MFKHPNSYSMESDPLELDQDEVLGPLPSDAEVVTLLRNSPAHPHFSPLTDHEESPTAAIKTALEAKISEELGEFGKTSSKLYPLPSKNDCGSVESSNGQDAACVAAGGGNQAAAEGTVVGPQVDPMHANSAPDQIQPKNTNQVKTTKTQGACGNTREVKTSNGDAARGDSGKILDTYADRTKTKNRPDEMGKFILHIYSTQDRKNPLSLEDWNRVDEQLIQGLIEHPDPIQITSSSYVSKHWFGFVACRDEKSQDWVKGLVRTMRGNNVGYRAWSRDEKPFLPVCRLFLPSRFDSLDDATALQQLLKYNPTLRADELNLKGSEVVQGGRAIFLEMTPDNYTQIKTKNHRLCFLATYVDCQTWTQSGPKRKVGLGAHVDGIRKLDSGSEQTIRTTSHTTIPTTSQNPKDPRLSRGHLPHLTQPQTSTPSTEQHTESLIPVDHVGEGKKRKRSRGGRGRKLKPLAPDTHTQTNINTSSISNNISNNSATHVVIVVSPESEKQKDKFMSGH